MNADISATAAEPIKEPDLTWNASAQGAGTEDLRQQIGGLNPVSSLQNQSDRGLWILLTSPADLRSQLNGTVQAASTLDPPPTGASAQGFLKMHIRDKVMWEGDLCARCKLPADDPVSATRFIDTGGITQQVFQDILKDVGDLSLAYSGFLFLMARMAHYD